MKIKSRILCLLLSLVMLLGCIAVPAMAEEAAGGTETGGTETGGNEAGGTGTTTETTPEIVNQDGSITIKEGYDIPADQAVLYGDKEQYPIAVFADGVFQKGLKYISTTTETSKSDYLYGYIGPKKQDFAGMKVDVVFRRDYTVDRSKTDGNDIYEEASTWNFVQWVLLGSFNFDLNGYTLDAKDIYLFPFNIKGYTGEKNYVLNVYNGTIKGQKEILRIACGVNNPDSAAVSKLFWGADISFTNVHFDLVGAVVDEVAQEVCTVKVISDNGMHIFKYNEDPEQSWIRESAPDHKFKINISFENCTTANGEPAIWDLAENADLADLEIALNCIHADNDGNGACDFCGYIPPIPFTVETDFSNGITITYITQLSKLVKTVELTLPDGTPQTISVDALSEQLVDGYYRLPISFSADATSDTYSMRFLDEAGNPLDMVNEIGEVSTSYTYSVIDAINGLIALGDDAVKKALEQATAAIEAKTAELETAIASKADAAQVAALITQLESTIKGAYELADATNSSKITSLTTELNNLNAALEESEDDIYFAISTLQGELDDAVADLEDAIAQKADATTLNEKYAALAAAYAAADLVLDESDESLKAADAALKSFLDKIKADTASVGERIDAANTMGTVQIILIVVAALAAAAAFVLPIIMGKKKKENA